LDNPLSSDKITPIQLPVPAASQDLLIDATHKRWITGTAVTAVLATGVYWWIDRGIPGGLTGGSTVGLWYGAAGALLMVYAGLLAAHRKLLRWALVPSRQWWLRGHIWLGLLSTVFLLCHSNFRWGGPLERILWVVFALVLLTGVAGLALQQFLPRLLTTRLSAEAPYEQIPHLCRVLRRKSDSLAAEIVARVDEGGRAEFTVFYQKVADFLGERYRANLALAHPVQAEVAFETLHASPGLTPVRDKVDELKRYCEERRQLGEQERLHHWLHAWLLLHVPLAIALLVLGVAHAVMSLYF
jgi:hypothetical protein